MRHVKICQPAVKPGIKGVRIPARSRTKPRAQVNSLSEGVGCAERQAVVKPPVNRQLKFMAVRQARALVSENQAEILQACVGVGRGIDAPG